jgi:hypothetical protein
MTMDVTFDTYGIDIKQQEITLMDRYRNRLKEKFKILVQSLDQYQTDIVFNKSIELPLKITANAGCLTGDTIIRFNRAGKGFKVKLRDAYLRFHGLDKHPSIWRKNIETKIRSYYIEENRIKLNIVLDIVESGVKSIFRIKFGREKFLNCTSDHLILTKRGWIEAINLKPDDYICVDKLCKHKKTSKGVFKEKLKDAEKAVGKYHPFAKKSIINKGRQIAYTVPIHRLLLEAHKNNMGLENFIKITWNKDKASELYYIDTSINCIHHKDFNHYNNKINNLQEMNKIEHLKLHTLGYNNFKHGVPEYTKVREVINLNKKEMTYDIQCESPHNFVANNIVVHNSGKTQCLLAKALKMVIEDGIYPASIVLITFTNKASNEIRERYINFFRGVLSEGEITEISLPHISTIHSFACSILYKLFGLRRTILTEYHALKLLKPIMLDVLKLFKIEQTKVKILYTLIQEIYANNEVHFFCIPQFNSNSTFYKILVGEHSSLLDSFSNAGIVAKLNGGDLKVDQDIKDRVRGSYASKVNMSVDQLTEILTVFLERKYISNTTDFSDMRFLPFIIFNQYETKLKEIWTLYKYFLIDEAQDMNCMDFVLIVTCDEDSYKRFLR